MDTTKFLEKIKTLLQENENLINRSYNNKDDQILIDKKLIDKISSYLAYYFQDEKHRLSMIKVFLRQLFELKEQDILIFKEGYIFIKYISNLKQNIPQGRENTNQVRYNGFDEEEMKAFFEKFFTPEETKKLIEKIAKKFVDEVIIESQISNAEYEKKVFGIIKELVYQELLEMYENKDEFMLGFAGYIFRIHFEQFFYQIAQEIIDAMIRNEKAVIEFMEYYTHDVILINGDKYQVPVIQTTNNQKWKIVSILSIVRVYVTAKHHILKLKKDMHTLEQKLREFHSTDGNSPLERQKKLHAKIQQLQKVIGHKEHLVLKHKKYLQENEQIPAQEKSTYRKKIFLLTQEVENLKKELNHLQALLLPQTALTQYQKLQHELHSLKKELHNKLRILEQNKKNYIAICKALVRSLTKKKKKLA
ncbi:MAG: hypothetical protein GXO11_08650 [Epsilonproteobacteria bacterium]|nr:hypothetical protein [Campylobacterota bacterium]